MSQEFEYQRQFRVQMLSRLAREALAVQDACNLKGVIVGLAEAREQILLLGGRQQGTDWFNRHPIMRLYASKIHSLAGLGLSDEGAFSAAFELCSRMAQGDVDCWRL